MTFERFIIIIAVIGIAMLLVGVVLALRQRPKGSTAHEAVTGDKPAANVRADAILVLRDPVSSEWLVEVNGMQYRSLKDIHDDRTAGKVLEALSGLQRFAGTIPIVKPELKATPGVVASTSVAPAKNIEPSVAQAMKPGSTTVSTALYPAPPNSILDQIEKILQHNLMRYPEFAERKIHVGAASDGSLLIEVDRQFYQHADEVPDLTIRGVIKASIQEWERSA